MIAAVRETDAFRLEKIKKQLKCSDEEAQEILEFDKRVDKLKNGERTEYDLSPEEEKAAMKYTHTGTKTKKPTVYNWENSKPKKQDAVKRLLVNKLYEALAETVENPEIVNPQQKFSFTYGGHSYSVTLTRHNKKEGSA